jgi:hypothetical protein
VPVSTAMGESPRRGISAITLPLSVGEYFRDPKLGDRTETGFFQPIAR